MENEHGKNEPVLIRPKFVFKPESVKYWKQWSAIRTLGSNELTHERKEYNGNHILELLRQGKSKATLSRNDYSDNECT